MPHKSPETVPLITYVWVLLLSIWGGVASNIRKIRNGTIKHFSLSELIGDMVISGFIGVITYYICDYYELHQMLTAFAVGMSGHMGTRAIHLAEIAIGKRFGVKLEE